MLWYQVLINLVLFTLTSGTEVELGSGSGDGITDCATGYKLIDGQCQADRCAEVPDPENGIGLKYDSGSIIHFSCLSGYYLQGNKSIICTENGWSNAAPKCIQRPDATCLKSPPSIENSDYTYQMYQHEDNGEAYYMANYTCCQGCLQTGDTAMFCSQGHWIWPTHQLHCTPTCSTPSFYCEQSCIGTSCRCGKGYVMDENSQTCYKIDECTYRPFCKHGVCQDYSGRYYCHCNAGFTLVRKEPSHCSFDDRPTCVDINECETEDCDHICVNTIGSYSCACKEGYVLGNDRFTCLDINECESTEANSCSHECVNIEGSYKCLCPHGLVITSSGNCEACPSDTYYNLNAKACFKCPENSGTLGEHGSTTITNCICNDGYSSFGNGSERVCKDIDECEENNFGCSYQCVNTPGSAYCLCESGYEVDETFKTCRVKKKICEMRNGGCQHFCTDNITGGFNCSCKDGYIQDPNDAHRCIDINECLDNNGGCEINCKNYEGGYYCSCTETSLLNDDGVSCDEIVCNSLKVPENGRLSPKKLCTGMDHTIKVGTVCDYSCKIGFNLFQSFKRRREPISRRTCLRTGRWSGETPICKPITCPPLPPIQFGEINPPSCMVNPQNYKAKCLFTCKPGYVLDGNELSKCKGVEGWTSGTPKCVPVSFCAPLPLMEHAEVIPSNCAVNPQIPKTQCAYICKSGYVVDGNQFLKCKGTGDWTSATPKCVREASSPKTDYKTNFIGSEQ